MPCCQKSSCRFPASRNFPTAASSLSQEERHVELVRHHYHSHDHWRVTLIQPIHTQLTTQTLTLQFPGCSTPHSQNHCTHRAGANPSSSDTMVSKILFWSGFGTRKHPPNKSRN